MKVDQIITRILEREKGYVNLKADSGGPTKFGITQDKLSEFLGRPATLQDVQNLSEGVARDIYEKDFANMGLDIAPDECRDLLLDIMENHGPKNGVPILQRALRVTVDGVFGRGTRAALEAANGLVLYRRLVAERLRFTGRMISKNLADKDHDNVPDNTEFAEGWLNRQAAFVEETP